VRDLLVALLYPEGLLRALNARRDADNPDPCRAVLTLQLGSGVYRIGADLEGQRLALARFDSESDRFARIAGDGEAAAQKLRELGRPDRSVLETLAFLGFEGPSPFREGTELDAPTPVEPVDLPRRVSQAPPLPQPDRNPALLQLEREEKRLEEEIEKFAALMESGEDLEVLIERYRVLREECARDLDAVERTRESLLADRARLQSVPPAQAPWIWTGLALGVSGALAGSFVQPWIALLGILGLGVATTAFTIARSARRRLGRLDARLAALRVRERALERRFEESAAPVRTPLVALELGSIEELEDAVRRMRELTGRLEQVRSEIETARRDLSSEPGAAPTAPPAAIDEVPPPAAEPATASVPHDEETPAEPVSGPDRAIVRLLESAADWTGRAVEDLRAELGACLPLYLRAVSGGRLRDMVPIGAQVWGVIREEGTAVPRTALSETERRHADVAFHLALLERVAPARRLVLIVGPSVGEAGDDPAGLGRALARVAHVAQVIQLAEVDVPWRQFAAQSHRLG
jgi:hypothetical protein